ncbi:Cof-type HAD-IIB family hydrolase [Fervidibacillus halotolerans]|uniref:Cof-type HAD-IIB family hydrolase n=1 Tax=Fervidibacillus halotolerans TaxID=2980027 RepID=A0A9E8M0P5_9BACI|nr:Cof-type HAD-IIB family hydrolase [Fervidibacillus halotolerans]WAA13054.1 Cof-type HAD-IIB family hydrolase [Fervidibacillus halotolerans]
MREQYLIALDLDGTLLTDKKTISDKTKKVLKQVQEEGHIVMISTGRSYRMSEMYYKELGLTSPIVNFNGAFVHHPLKPEWGTIHEPLEIETAKEIVTTCEEYSFRNIVAEVVDKVFIHYHDEKLLNLIQIGNPTITTGDLRTSLLENPTNMLIHSDQKSVDHIRSFLSDTLSDKIEYRTWADPYHVIEINKRGINKAVGLKKVADSYQIPKDRIIAFGDEDNDVEMLQFAKYGIAMGNGIDRVKEVAKDVTLTNEQDGVAVYLEKLLLS